MPSRRTTKGALDSLYAPPGSDARAFAEAIAWLWRLPLDPEPSSRAMALGAGEDAGDLVDLLRRGRLGGAIVLAAHGGDSQLLRPRSELVRGVADFPDGSVKGAFTVFRDGRPLLRSRLGAHAVEQDGVVYVGSSPGDWGRASAYWVLCLLADLLREELGRPLVALPPLGCLRLDDVPGTALQQVRGRAHPDRTMVSRIRKLTRCYREAGARLVVAVASQALDGAAPVPLDAVWPESVAALRDGVREGVLELACHGTLHLDVEAFASGTVEATEFARLGEEEARRRIEQSLRWLRQAVGEPESFIAPAWGYSPGALAAATATGLPVWRAPAPGPLLSDGQLFETTRDSLEGVSGVDYRFLSALARIGVPPTVVFHGRLLDHRRDTLEFPRDTIASMRLALRPDLVRIPTVPGVRWVGARELVQALRAHDETRLGADLRTVVGPGASHILA